MERWAIRYARIALGAAFLSGIMSRFGLWGDGVGYGNFATFMRYTAEVNSFMPAARELTGLTAAARSFNTKPYG